MKHIVALSGGKDSTALALRLAEVEPRDYIYICTPTGDELPPMVEHWKKLEKILGKPIIYLGDQTIFELIDEMKMLPNWRARWCTRILKIEACQEYYNENKPAKIYVGLRADEEKRTGNKLFDDDIEQVFPLREWDWGLNEVLNYLDKKQITIPKRTDCGMCFFQRISEWWALWDEYPERFQKYIELEERIGHTFMSPGKFTNWPHALKDLKAEFDKGRIPASVSLQQELFDNSKCRVCSL